MVHGFQMWINLPNKDKMCKPRYQDIQPENIPVVEKENIKIKVIAGKYEQVINIFYFLFYFLFFIFYFLFFFYKINFFFFQTEGPVNGIATQPIFFDIRLKPNTLFEHHIPKGHTCFAYLFEGSASFSNSPSLKEGNIIVFDSDGDTIQVNTDSNSNAAFLLVAAKPIVTTKFFYFFLNFLLFFLFQGEPIFQRGPFVMASQEDLVQAFIDIQTGMFLKRAN